MILLPVSLSALCFATCEEHFYCGFAKGGKWLLNPFTYIPVAPADDVNLEGFDWFQYLHQCTQYVFDLLHFTVCKLRTELI